MGRFDPKYTDAQRRAIAAAIAEHNTTAPEVVRMAAAGELDDVEPFEIPESTVRDIAAAAKNESANPLSFEDQRNQVGDLADILREETRRIQAKQEKGGQLSGADISRVGKLARSGAILREELKAIDAAEQKATKAPRRSPDKDAPTPSAVERLINANANGDTTAPNGNARNGA